MRSVIYIVFFFIVCALASCGNTGKAKTDETLDSLETRNKAQRIGYIILSKPEVDLSDFEKDKEGFIHIFNGENFLGWRGYGKDIVPDNWSVEDGAIKINGTGRGMAHDENGGDIIFQYQFKNFELKFDYKVAKGGDSGVFYLAQEVQTFDPASGRLKMEPIYISAPEAQILDNENHVNGRTGKDGNRQSMSLVDMLPAKPQNSKPYGEWNEAGIIVYKGLAIHRQNGVDVLEYNLWTPQWIELLQSGKFSKENWPLAFELLKDAGGSNQKGYIGLQDCGDDVWFRNIRIKILD
ncbi:DUF1080 domain-containing protein [Bacteroides sp. OttesenSCG-928-E20]|nr:DUF1080 domain-containing protein [Bacteroides sp. OttesenSCG-928-E20]MDL2304455.1 DUF1080 domain-containing protein [Bacteroides sp. OttesenSCG-928-D19]